MFHLYFVLTHYLFLLCSIAAGCGILSFIFWIVDILLCMANLLLSLLVPHHSFLYLIVQLYIIALAPPSLVIIPA